MNCEIEFMPVGTGSKPGDAIIVRYGAPDAYELMIVDGGTQESGEALVQHVRSYYGQHATINHVVLTHADGDHASGLRDVLQELQVRNLWINPPWSFAGDALPFFKDKTLTEHDLSVLLHGEYDIVAEIFDLAKARNINMRYALQGAQIGPFHVMSPSRFQYACLLAQFDRTPDPDQAALERIGMWIEKASLFDKLFGEALAKVQGWTKETWSIERLQDGGKTSASNESSVVLYGNFESGQRVLLTGDAGGRALTWTADYADSFGWPLRQFTFVQVPHHGSRRNVGPAILNRLIGTPAPEGTERFTAFISAPKDDSTHPRQIVVNAFRRRGAKVASTKGIRIVHYGGFPAREGYVDLEYLPFSLDVEEYS